MTDEKYWGVIKNDKEKTFQIIGEFSNKSKSDLFKAEKVDEVICKLKSFKLPYRSEFPAGKTRDSIILDYQHIGYTENPHLMSSLKQQLRVLKLQSDQTDLIEIVLSAIDTLE